MTEVGSPQHQHEQSDPDLFVRLGGWLFQRRTWLPLPLVIALLATPSDDRRTPLFFGVAVVTLGEWVRLWAVHHIGVISRTRSERLGPLVSTGPFAFVRNPLYLGNIALWVGFALSARLVWMAPIVAAILAFEYHAIVRWEERLLESRRGDEYRNYVARVPRWLPARGMAATSRRQTLYSWRDTFFSERGTFLAIAAGYVLLWMKLKS